MDWGNIISGAAAVGSGGILGVVGSVFGVVGKYFQEKQRQSFEIQKWDHETKLIELQMEGSVG